MLGLQGSAGSQAVRAAGSGVLRGVRAIPLLRGTLFWFVVDSAVLAGAPALSAPAQLPEPDARFSNPAGNATPALPAREQGWAQETLEAKPTQSGFGGRGTGVGNEHCGVADGDAAQQRSKAWHAAHHSARAACEYELEHTAQAKRQRRE